jgi:hypothetical protein
MFKIKEINNNKKLMKINNPYVLHILEQRSRFQRNKSKKNRHYDI